MNISGEFLGMDDSEAKNITAKIGPFPCYDVVRHSENLVSELGQMIFPHPG